MIERPLQAERWNLTVRPVVDRPIGDGDGESCWPSTTRRAGSDTLVTASGPVPVVGQPFTVVGGGAVFATTTAVCAEVACALPSPFFAATRTHRVFPRRRA